MKAGKKLLATLFTTVIFIICLSSTIYATELDSDEMQPVQEAVTEGTDHAIEDTQEAEKQIIEVQATEETSFAVKETQMSDSSDLTKEEAVLCEGDLPADGQSQAYSIKSKEEEINDGEKKKEEKSIDEEKIAEEKKAEEKKSVEKIDKDELNEKENKKEEKGKKDRKDKKEKPSYSKEDLRLLASLIYSEAGNQSYNGMLAVANTVINREKSNVFGHVDTIKEVIYDNKWCVQFSVTIKDKKSGKSILDKALECYDTGKFPGSNKDTKKESMQRATKAAKAALEGENNIGGYLCFRANNKYAASIKKKYDYKVIGGHIFYRTK